jgi:predicted acylesterase/phospholipase RssA
MRALKHLGFPDATVVSRRSWVYVADEVQKIQIVFLANCRDETTTHLAPRGFLEWLAQVQEDVRLSERAEARGRIVRGIARQAAVRRKASLPRRKRRSAHILFKPNPTNSTHMSLKDKLQKTGARKLLACDGGGIRGIISVEILAKIEADLRASSGKPELVLADYFDYVAGTSTGAIIATLVALGFSTEQIRDFYLKSGAEMFEKAKLWERFRTKFRDDKLSAMMRDIIGEDTTLGSDKLQTLLLVVLRNATTDSPWPLSNNPSAKYNDRNRADCNLLLPLWQLVRASTAAPTYFPPERVVVGPHDFVFVDGGVTMYNNPAFQLFLMATAEPFCLAWPTGADQMLLVSVGTGASANAKADLSPDEMTLLYNAGTIPSALMAAALYEQDFLCRILGNCVAGDLLDREVGTVIGQGIPGTPKLFTYARYNAELSAEGLAELGLAGMNPAYVQQMDSVEHIAEMQQVGRAVAEKKVKAAHLAGFPA